MSVCLFYFFVKLFHQDKNKLKFSGASIVSILNWYKNIHSETKIIICTRKAWQQHDIILDPSKLVDRLIMSTAWAARTLILQQLSANVQMKIYQMYSLPADVNPEITSSIQPAEVFAVSPRSKLLSSSRFQTEMMSSKEMRCPCKVCKKDFGYTSPTGTWLMTRWQGEIKALTTLSNHLSLKSMKLVTLMLHV